MSGTRYGRWRYLLIRQRKLESSLAAGVDSLAGLAGSLAVAPPERQFTLISLEAERVKRDACKTLLPLYSLKAAAGYFGNAEPVEPEGWVEADGVGRLDERMFVCRAVGRSMEPRIHDGDYVIFRAKPAGTRQGKIVLVQYHGAADPNTGGSYTDKRYSSEKAASEDDDWRHARIVLSPVNPEYEPIVISPDESGHVAVIAEMVTCCGERREEEARARRATAAGPIAGEQKNSRKRRGSGITASTSSAKLAASGGEFLLSPARLRGVEHR